MKDFLGRELEINDYVIMINPGYREFKLAQVIKFTPMSARVKYGPTHYEEILQGPSQLVKVEGPDLTAALLKQK